jgi:hypothetical protein
VKRKDWGPKKMKYGKISRQALKLPKKNLK